MNDKFSQRFWAELNDQARAIAELICSVNGSNESNIRVLTQHIQEILGNQWDNWGARSGRTLVAVERGRKDA